ncbi:MAG: Fpg/Nei family DNA glycosylase [Anaerolineae bacterium]
MPELPELEVIREVIHRRLVGRKLVEAQLLRPLVVRAPAPLDLQDPFVDQTLEGVERRGKFLFLHWPAPEKIVINPMLVGRFHLTHPGSQRLASTIVVWRFEGDLELRYTDPQAMGKIYLVRSLTDVPGLASLGPEPLAIGPEAFGERLHRRRGEIKGILVNQKFLAGIGNAYADEILWRARIYPFLRRPQLSDEEEARLHEAIRTELEEATARVREEMGEDISLKPRQSLSVHGKGGDPCPRCGTKITEIRGRNRLTNFCRVCQPGIMAGRTRRLAKAEQES